MPSKKPHPPERHVSEYRLKGRHGSGLVRIDTTLQGGQVTRYSLVYVNHSLCALDNGRVLGYDNSHDYHHRHYMGDVKPFKFESYEKLLARFEAEVMEIRRKADEQDY